MRSTLRPRIRLQSSTMTQAQAPAQNGACDILLLLRAPRTLHIARGALAAALRNALHAFGSGHGGAICGSLTYGTIDAGETLCRLQVASADAAQAFAVAHRLLARLQEHMPHLRSELKDAPDLTPAPRATLDELERRGGWRMPMFDNDLAMLREHLKGIDPSALREFPRMRMARIYLMCKDDRLSEARREWREFFQDVVQHRYPALPHWEVGALRELLAGYTEAPVTTMRFRRVEKLSQEIPLHDPISRGVAYNCMCFIAIEAQEPALARRHARTALDAYTQVGSLYGCMYMRYHLGVALARSGLLKEAEREYVRGIALARRMEGPGRELGGLGVVLRARMHYQCNRLAQAARGLRGAVDAIEHGESWSEIFLTAYRTQIDLAALEPHAAALPRALLHARTTARTRGLKRLEILIGLHEIEIDLRHGRANAAQRHAHALGLAALCAREIERDLAWREPIYYARYLDLLQRLPGVRASDRAQAQELVDAAKTLEFFTLQLRAMLLLAQIDMALGATEAACARIDEALALVLPERPLRVLLDHPGILELIQAYRRAPRAQRSGRERSGLAAEIEHVAHAETRQTHVREHSIVLSQRELDFINQLAAGLRNKEIAQRLQRSENTVKFHLKRLNRKFGTHRRSELLARARDVGLLD